MNEEKRESGRIRVSPGVSLAWRIAAAEAAQAGAEYIEKEHLLIGIYSLETVLPSKSAPHEKTLESLYNEKKALEFPFCNSDLNPAAIRLKIRNALPLGKVPGNARVVHRSPECRNCFEKAAVLSGDKDMTCIHLLNAILDDPGPVIAGVMDTLLPVQQRDLSASACMKQAVLEYQAVNEQKDHLIQDIEHSRHTLSGVRHQTDRYLQLRYDLLKKTLELARVCLRINDTSGLIRALKELSTEELAQGCHIEEIISQVEYLHNEGICIGVQSSKRIETMLQDIEKKIAGFPG
jgi:hypothetical protein